MTSLVTSHNILPPCVTSQSGVAPYFTAKNATADGVAPKSDLGSAVSSQSNMASEVASQNVVTSCAVSQSVLDTGVTSKNSMTSSMISDSKPSIATPSVASPGEIAANVTYQYSVSKCTEGREEGSVLATTLGPLGTLDSKTKVSSANPSVCPTSHSPSRRVVHAPTYTPEVLAVSVTSSNGGVDSKGSPNTQDSLCSWKPKSEVTVVVSKPKSVTVVPSNLDKDLISVDVGKDSPKPSDTILVESIDKSIDKTHRTEAENLIVNHETSAVAKNEIGSGVGKERVSPMAITMGNEKEQKLEKETSSVLDLSLSNNNITDTVEIEYDSQCKQPNQQQTAAATVTSSHTSTVSKSESLSQKAVSGQKSHAFNKSSPYSGHESVNRSWSLESPYSHDDMSRTGPSRSPYYMSFDPRILQFYTAEDQRKLIESGFIPHTYSSSSPQAAHTGSRNDTQTPTHTQSILEPSRHPLSHSLGPPPSFGRSLSMDTSLLAHAGSYGSLFRNVEDNLAKGYYEFLCRQGSGDPATSCVATSSPVSDIKVTNHSNQSGNKAQFKSDTKSDKYNPKSSGTSKAETSKDKEFVNGSTRSSNPSSEHRMRSTTSGQRSTPSLPDVSPHPGSQQPSRKRTHSPAQQSPGAAIPVGIAIARKRPDSLDKRDSERTRSLSRTAPNTGSSSVARDGGGSRSCSSRSESRGAPFASATSGLTPNLMLTGGDLPSLLNGTNGRGVGLSTPHPQDTAHPVTSSHERGAATPVSPSPIATSTVTSRSSSSSNYWLGHGVFSLPPASRQGALLQYNPPPGYSIAQDPATRQLFVVPDFGGILSGLSPHQPSPLSGGSTGPSTARSPSEHGSGRPDSRASRATPSLLTPPPPPSSLLSDPRHTPTSSPTVLSPKSHCQESSKTSALHSPNSTLSGLKSPLLYPATDVSTSQRRGLGGGSALIGGTDPRGMMSPLPPSSSAGAAANLTASLLAAAAPSLLPPPPPFLSALPPHTPPSATHPFAAAAAAFPFSFAAHPYFWGSHTQSAYPSGGPMAPGLYPMINTPTPPRRSGSASSPNRPHSRGTSPMETGVGKGAGTRKESCSTRSRAGVKRGVKDGSVQTSKVKVVCASAQTCPELLHTLIATAIKKEKVEECCRIDVETLPPKDSSSQTDSTLSEVDWNSSVESSNTTQEESCKCSCHKKSCGIHESRIKSEQDSSDQYRTPNDCSEASTQSPGMSVAVRTTVEQDSELPPGSMDALHILSTLALHNTTVPLPSNHAHYLGPLCTPTTPGRVHFSPPLSYPSESTGGGALSDYSRPLTIDTSLPPPYSDSKLAHFRRYSMGAPLSSYSRASTNSSMSPDLHSDINMARTRSASERPDRKRQRQMTVYEDDSAFAAFNFPGCEVIGTTEAEVRSRMAEIQRQYREKQRELARLKPRTASKDSRKSVCSGSSKKSSVTSAGSATKRRHSSTKSSGSPSPPTGPRTLPTAAATSCPISGSALGGEGNKRKPSTSRERCTSVSKERRRRKSVSIDRSSSFSRQKSTKDKNESEVESIAKTLDGNRDVTSSVGKTKAATCPRTKAQLKYMQHGDSGGTDRKSGSHAVSHKNSDVSTQSRSMSDDLDMGELSSLLEVTRLEADGSSPAKGKVAKKLPFSASFNDSPPSDGAGSSNSSGRAGSQSLGLLTRYASSQMETSEKRQKLAGGEQKANAEAGDQVKKRKRGRPRKYSLEETSSSSTTQTQTLVSKPSKQFSYFNVGKSVKRMKSVKEGPRTSLLQAQKDWNRRRSERIFLSDASSHGTPTPPPHTAPHPATPHTASTDTARSKAPSPLKPSLLSASLGRQQTSSIPATYRTSSASYVSKSGVNRDSAENPTQSASPARVPTLAERVQKPGIERAAGNGVVRSSGSGVARPGGGAKLKTYSKQDSQAAKMACGTSGRREGFSFHSDTSSDTSSSSSSTSSSDSEEDVSTSLVSRGGSTVHPQLGPIPAHSIFATPPLPIKKTVKEEEGSRPRKSESEGLREQGLSGSKKTEKDQPKKSTKTEVKNEVAKGTTGNKGAGSTNKCSVIPGELQEVERPTSPVPEIRSSVLRQEDLYDGLGVLYFMDGLFYEARVKEIQVPDVYGVVVKGERGNRPHILSREDLLNDAVLDIRPPSLCNVPVGRRVCAYWSQQFSCLYPGLVVKTGAPVAKGAGSRVQKLVHVEFDDGDDGNIHLEHVRLLPQDFPIQCNVPVGRRVCAYWSQQFSCLYLGLVVKTGAPVAKGAGSRVQKLVHVEFDDGDDGNIHLEHVRLLPQDFPIQCNVPVGRRVCAYWSQQFSCLYLGLVVKTGAPVAKGAGSRVQKLVHVEFDDGDDGNIHLEHVRLLPQDFPIQCNVPVGRRVCAYWSQQFSCLYLGLVVKTGAPVAKGAGSRVQKLVHVEFDDGDDGNIHLEHVRLLPQDFPIQSYDDDPPSPSPGKRKKRSISEDLMADSWRERLPSLPDSGLTRFQVMERQKAEAKRKMELLREREAQNKEETEEAEGRGVERGDRERGRSPASSTRSSSTPGDRRATSGDRRGTSGNRRSISGDRRGTSGDRQGTSRDRRSISGHRRGTFGDRRSITGDRRGSSVGHRSGSDEQDSSDSDSEDGHGFTANSTPKKARSVSGGDTGTPGKVTTPGKRKEKAETPTTPKNSGKGEKKSRTPSSASKKRERKNSTVLPAHQLWSWMGSGQKRPKKTFYRALRRGDEVLRIGDCAVFLTVGRPHLPYIGRIESLFETRGGAQTVRVKWFYHPEETKGGKRLAQVKGALYESPHGDENDVQTISHRCEVISYTRYKSLLAAHAQNVSSGGESSTTSADTTGPSTVSKEAGVGGAESAGPILDMDNVYYLAGYYDPTTNLIKFEGDVKVQGKTW